jgi:hypothetical protein
LGSTSQNSTASSATILLLGSVAVAKVYSKGKETMQPSLGPMLRMAVAAAAMAACSSIAQASVHGDSISIAFGRDEPPTTPGCHLAPRDVTGVEHFRSANWNNEIGNIGTEDNLIRDTNGAARTTDARISWTADNTWSTEPGGSRTQFNNNCFGGANEALMTGYLDAGAGTAEGFTTITIDNLPHDLAEGYSVVIYSLGSVSNRPAAFFVNDPAMANPKYIVPGGNRTLYKHVYSGPNYVKAIGDDAHLGATGSTDDCGNYLVFTHLRGDLTIIAKPLTSATGTNRAAVNAIQIIESRED